MKKFLLLRFPFDRKGKEVCKSELEPQKTFQEAAQVIAAASSAMEVLIILHSLRHILNAEPALIYIIDRNLYCIRKRLRINVCTNSDLRKFREDSEKFEWASPPKALP